MIQTVLPRCAAGAMSLALMAAVLAPAPGHAAEATWAPYPVQVWDEPFNMESSRTALDYTPVSDASQAWHLCVSLPHLKDSYWRAVNFGLAEEARRLGVKMTMKTAGGYTELDQQKQDLRACAETDADAVIVGAISNTELNDIVVDLEDQGIPVIDLVNGMSTEAMSAKSLVDFGEMGTRTGRFLVGERAGESARIAWFPGPEGAAWVAAGDTGFKSALDGTSLDVAKTIYGDTVPETQETLVREALANMPNLDVIAGTAVTATAAVEVLDELGRAGEVDVIAYYLTPTVYRAIRAGKILAAPTDSPVIQARIAVDQAVRILDGKEVQKHVGPEIIVLDRSTISFFDYLSALPPRGFEPVMAVN